MKKSAIALSVVGLLHGACFAGEPVGTEAVNAPAGEAEEITSDIEKINYSLGYELGKDLKRRELDLAREALVKGAADALAGNRPLVDARQRQAVLKDLKDKKIRSTSRLRRRSLPPMRRRRTSSRCPADCSTRCSRSEGVRVQRRPAA